VTSPHDDPDAPQPPGGPLRQDAPEGDFAPDEQREELADRDEQPTGSDVPDVTHGADEQSAGEAARQEENAETSADQPSS
jgi:hypothetical protein